MKRLEAARTFPGVLAAALGVAALQAACATDLLHQNTLATEDDDAPDASLLQIFFYRNNTPSTANTTVYRLFVDGDLLVDDGTYFQFNSSSGASMAIPSGQHVFELRDPSGGRYVTTPPLESRPGLLHHLVFFGDGSAPEFRFYLDDPAPVPSGMTHVRLLNATSTREDLTALSCTNIPIATASCAPLGTAPVAYGETFEVDWPRGALLQLGWSAAGMNVPQPIVEILPGPAIEPPPPAYSGGCVPDFLSAILQVDPTGDYGAGSFDSSVSSYLPFCSGT